MILAPTETHVLEDPWGGTPEGWIEDPGWGARQQRPLRKHPALGGVFSFKLRLPRRIALEVDEVLLDAAQPLAKVREDLAERHWPLGLNRPPVVVVHGRRLVWLVMRRLMCRSGFDLAAMSAAAWPAENTGRALASSSPDERCGQGLVP